MLPLTFLCVHAHKARGRHGPPSAARLTFPTIGAPQPICFLVLATCFPVTCQLVLGGSRALWKPEGRAARLPSRESAASVRRQQVSHAAGTCHHQPPPSVQGLCTPSSCPPREKEHGCGVSPRGTVVVFPCWAGLLCAAASVAYPSGQSVWLLGSRRC